MIKLVHKFQLVPNDLTSVDMPTGAEVLHFDVQNGAPCIWARVDPLEPFETRWFRMAGTGHPLGGSGIDIGRHVGTVLLDNGLVFHLFEAAPK